MAGDLPLKVLVTGSTFPRWDGDRLPDFVWKQVLHVKRVVPGLRASVLAPHDAGARKREEWEEVEIRRFRYFLPASLQRLAYPAIWPNLQRTPWLLAQVPFFLLFEFLATWRWIREERFDFVYSHWFMPQGVACGLAALLTGTPHGFTSHSSDVAVMRRLPLLGPWLVRLLVSRARAITVVSERSLSVLSGFFTPSRWGDVEPKVRVLPMGVDLEEWGNALSSAPSPPTSRREGSQTILFVGRLVEKKGVRYLLRAMTLEPLASMDASLVVVGEGPSRGELEREAASLGIQARVTFAGYAGGADKAAWFRMADVVVLPSIVAAGGDAEGLPVVLLEALAAGKICVATDASGAPDILRSSEDGFLVPAADPAALSRVTAEALSLPKDRRREISERARRTVARFDWPVVARAYARHMFSGR